jgi:hypothetical protein
MRLLSCSYMGVFILLAILALGDANPLSPDQPAPSEKSCSDYCSHSGVCYLTDDGPNCICRRGWMGLRCDHIQESSRNAQSYSGDSELESLRADFCSIVPDWCKNGGTCFFDNSVNQLKCLCPSGYTGPDCKTETNCKGEPCKNGGICIPTNDINSPPTCRCLPGFIGYLCQNNVTTTTQFTTVTSPEICQFAPTFCQNGGTCDVHVNATANATLFCHCPPTHTGKNCENATGVIIVVPPTQSPGLPTTTQPPGPQITTTTQPPGPQITTTTQPGPTPPRETCTPNRCQNGAPCYINGNSYYCACRPSYFGRNCEISTG